MALAYLEAVGSGWAQTPILIHNPIDDNAEIGVRE
jgi:hypothetical protein